MLCYAVLCYAMLCYVMPCHAMLYDTVQDNEKREKKRSKIRIKARIQNGNMVYKTMMCKQLKGECECCASVVRVLCVSVY